MAPRRREAAPRPCSSAGGVGPGLRPCPACSAPLLSSSPLLSAPPVRGPLLSRAAVKWQTKARVGTRRRQWASRSVPLAVLARSLNGAKATRSVGERPAGVICRKLTSWLAFQLKTLGLFVVDRRRGKAQRAARCASAALSTTIPFVTGNATGSLSTDRSLNLPVTSRCLSALCLLFMPATRG